MKTDVLLAVKDAELRTHITALIDANCAESLNLAAEVTGSDAIPPLCNAPAPLLVLMDEEMALDLSFTWFESQELVNKVFILFCDEQNQMLAAMQAGFSDFVPTDTKADRFILTIERAGKKLASAYKNWRTMHELVGQLKDKSNGFKRIAIPDMEGVTFLHPEEIIRCEADRNYTTVFLSDGRKITSSKSLKEYEKLLDERLFIRLHHSHLINIQHVERYNRSEGSVTMSDESKVEVSRRRKAEFMTRLDQL